MSTDLATVHEHGAIARQEDFSPEIVLKRLDAIQSLMRKAMVQGVDYGVVPGTNSKPTLLKPGAEKLAVMFRLAPKYRTQKTFHEDGHLTVESTCQIYDLSESFLGEASAMCSTRESKYAWRKAERVCPECGKAAIIKGKAEYGGGWLCWAKKGGCNCKFADDDQQITSQTTDRVANQDLGDSYNTVLRIAEKRAFLGAIRLVTGSSALFDEEIPAVNERDEAPPPKQESDQPEIGVVGLWTRFLDGDPSINDVNKSLVEVKKIQHVPTRKAVWGLMKGRLEKAGYRFDDTTNNFIEVPF